MVRVGRRTFCWCGRRRFVPGGDVGARREIPLEGLLLAHQGPPHGQSFLNTYVICAHLECPLLRREEKKNGWPAWRAVPVGARARYVHAAQHTPRRPVGGAGLGRGPPAGTARVRRCMITCTTPSRPGSQPARPNSLLAKVIRPHLGQPSFPQPWPMYTHVLCVPDGSSSSPGAT